jgi:hypothetical protein
LAYTYAADAGLGKQLCEEGKHHWHMADAATVKCCRCPASEAYSDQNSEGPHDDSGDAKE